MRCGNLDSARLRHTLFDLQMRTDSCNISDAMIGGNPSEEAGGEEGADDSSRSGIDVVLNHSLNSSPMKKKDYMRHIKEYMKA